MIKKDIKTRTGKTWAYSNIVKEHFFKPKNFIDEKQEKTIKFNGMGEVGSPACGDMMRVWIWVDLKTEKIKSCKWRTFGCASAIAATSMMSVMVTEKGGMGISKVEKLKPKQITDRLKGLPTIKIHCSVLGDQALKSAIINYRERRKNAK